MLRHLARFIPILGFLPLAAFAQTSMSVGASVIHTDFSTSWATMAPKSDGTEAVSIHVENSGSLASKDAKLELVLPSGWRYVGTSGDAGTVHTDDKPYGELVDWDLNPVAGGQSVDILVSLDPIRGQEDTPLFISLSSAYSVPVYAQIAASSTAKSALWASWVRSLGSYATLTLREFWFRLTTGISLGFGQG
ncbi:MAG TPA: hypothetical protein VMU11_04395 [Verrucomicrobiae bacterium]|nr:hypothetical protein [Verrucomicrobiae bacterium]